MFNYDAANTGSAPYQSGPGAPVTAEWTFETGSDERDEPVTSPVVAGGTAYVGTAGQTLYAVDVADGTKQWSFDVEASGGIRVAPAVADGSVFFGDNAGKLYSLDAADGSKRWTNSYGARFAAPPAVHGGTLYAASAYTVHAVNPADGTRQWRRGMGESETYALAVGAGSVYAGTNGGTLEAFDPADGTEQWRVSDRFGENSITALAVANGTVFVAIGYPGGTSVYAFAAEDGSLQWSRDVTGDEWGVSSAMAVTDDTLYVPSNGGELIAVNADDGTERWSKESGSAVAPTVVDGTVYVDLYTDGRGNNLVARDAADGARLWSHQLESDLATTPVVVDGTVLVGDETGILRELVAAQ